ncbi:CDP-glycerol glycerophosphotransferase family protein [Qipengyuania sp. XHP0207]|uniref:CDP-glycerol glycerophosphotransferase family protein n=1 Tax=Qipengyuania sp. XHP0207 TaxID=3038078 RepID=UPI0024202490|nr:CDP-glycerol glycerophosphotransferase family protein [Qipengyuania sp. XHP0207]MDG5747277.1 CDP-glycerol glycerophosphotransferase family protein [Qipengyuania sp. XHP0207]
MIIAFKFLIRLISRLIPKSDLLIVSTFPDYDDTTRSLLSAVSESKFHTTFLVSEPEAAPSWVDSDDVALVRRNSVKGIWLFLRARVIIVTHGLYKFLPTTEKQVLCNVWHGMPIKKIGAYLPNWYPGKNAFDLTIAHSDLFRDIMAKSFDLPKSSVLRLFHPRLDQCCRTSHLRVEEIFSEARYLCLWLPTYRRSVRYDLRSDGDEDKASVNQPEQLKKLNALFKSSDTICIIKSHPNAPPLDLEEYSNIVCMTDSELLEANISLYQLLGICRLLITDLSSIYFDAVSVSKQTLLYCPDLNEYMKSRGIIDESYEIIRGKVITDFESLYEEVRSALCFDAGVISAFRQIERGDEKIGRYDGNATEKLLRRLGVLHRQSSL